MVVTMQAVPSLPEGQLSLVCQTWPAVHEWRNITHTGWNRLPV